MKKLMAHTMGTTRNAVRQSSEDSAPPTKVKAIVDTMSTAVKRPIAAASLPGLAAARM